MLLGTSSSNFLDKSEAESTLLVESKFTVLSTQSARRTNTPQNMMPNLDCEHVDCKK